MKLKELDEKTDLGTVKVVLSENLYNGSSLPSYGIETREVYLLGYTMGDFFVKLDKDSSRIYPMFRDSIGWDELADLEIVEK